MGTVDIFDAVVTSGIRDTHFFNGRLLTAGDLRTTQDAIVTRDRQLARAVGAGVGHGLEVTLTDPGLVGSGARPMLRVTSGLALSHRGDALELNDDVDVALIREPEAARAASGEFAICPPPRPVTSLLNFGLYVLTIAPASWFEGLAPMTELQTEGIGSACGRRYEVDGVRFGLTRVDLSAADTGDGGTTASPPVGGTTLREDVMQLATELDSQLGQLLSKLPISGLAQNVERKLSLLRNSVAHLCFGTEERRALIADPLGTGSRAKYGAIDRLFGDGTLAEAEVPLALLYWSVRGVEFVDGWAVRRPVITPAISTAWPTLASARRAAEGLATWLQFQQHLADLAGRPGVTLADLRAVDYFRWLPPVGILPLATGAAGESKTGVVVQHFFETRMKRAPVYMEGARAEFLVRSAREHPPIALAATDGASVPQELIWLYRVHENIKAYSTGVTPRPRPYLLFTSGHVPFRGAAKFDLSHWSYASYA